MSGDKQLVVSHCEFPAKTNRGFQMLPVLCKLAAAFRAPFPNDSARVQSCNVSLEAFAESLRPKLRTYRALSLQRLV